MRAGVCALAIMYVHRSTGQKIYQEEKNRESLSNNIKGECPVKRFMDVKSQDFLGSIK